MVRLGWSVKTSAVQMRVHLAGGQEGLLVSETIIGSFTLGEHMYQINGVMMDLHGTYDGILGLNFFAQHGLLADSNSFVSLLEAGGANLSTLGLQKDSAPNLKTASAMLHNTEIHLTTLQAAMAAESDSLTDILHHLQAEFHDIFCNDLGDVQNFPAIYPKPDLAFILKSTSNKVLHCIIHHLITYLKPCFLISMRCC